MRKSTTSWVNDISSRLTELSLEERASATKRLLSHYLRYTPTKHVLNDDLEADKGTLEALYDACDCLNRQEPIQYVLGYASFYDYDFLVNKHVLIPRPTTEEMVAYIIDRSGSRYASVIDLCTGSGCIAITLAKENAKAHIDAVDISREALGVAMHNAQKHGVTIDFYQLDILHDPLPHKQWEIIVSNPPYVLPQEKAYMSQRVFDHEPSEALFVPEENPLIFYKRIAGLSSKHLLPNGLVCLEIHEKLAHDVCAFFSQAGFTQVAVHRDLQNRDRWVTAAH